MGNCVVVLLGLTHASIVNPDPAPTLREADAGIRTKLFVPLKLNAWPTSPLLKAGPVKRPLFVLALSVASPFPGHQPTIPAGAGVQAGVTVKVALELVAVPTLFETTAAYMPALLTCTLLIVSDDAVAPGRLVPAWVHLSCSGAVADARIVKEAYPP